MSLSKSPRSGGHAGNDHFDPEQPRVPAGHPDGGQWTSLGALLGGIENATAAEPFGPEPLSSALPSDAVRLARAGSESNTIVVPGVSAGPRRLLLKQPLRPEHAATLFELWSAQNSPDSQTVLVLHRREPKFLSYGFTRAESEQFVFTHATVQKLTREETEKACNQFQAVQALLDDTYKKVLAESPDLGRAQLGSKLHFEMKRLIDGEGGPDLRGVVLNPALLAAERSFRKGQPEAPDNSDYGAAGSVRPDLIEKSSWGAAVQRLTPDTACIYEYTIGYRNMPLSRAILVGEATRQAFEADRFLHFVVTQMRPKSWRPEP